MAVEQSVIQEEKEIQWQRIVIGVAIAFFIIGMILNIHRYFTFYTSYDQGIFNQVFWNNLHGRLFQSSLSSVLSTNVVHTQEIPAVFYHRLGQHFTPSLLIWWPIYALFPSPITLSFLLVGLVTAAGLVLYVLARHYLEAPLATMITLSFYGANAVVGPSWGNFHDVCQIPLFVFGLFLALEKRWWWLYSVLAILIPFVREDSGIVLFSIGFYLLVSRRYPWLGVGLCIYSLGYILLLTNQVMPLFSEDISRRFMLERFGQYATGNEASTLDIIWGMITNPWRLIGELISPPGATLRYLIGHWLPLGFIPAIAPSAWLVAGFPLLKLLLAKGQSVLSINIRYAMAVVPGLFYGTILWWSKHPQYFRLRLRRFWSFCIGVSLFFTVLANPNRTLSFVIPDSIQPWVHVPLAQQWHHAGEIRSLLRQIPPDASVSATTYLVPHLSSRRAIIRFPLLQFRNDDKEVISVDYGIADLWQLQRYQSAFKGDRQDLATAADTLENLLAGTEYGLTHMREGVILLERGKPSDERAIATWKEFRQSLYPIAS